MPLEPLVISALHVGYQGNEALHDVTLTVAAGDYLGIAGPNGSGKSTLIKSVLGLVPPYSGQITLFGTRREAFREWHRIGYLPQGLQYFNPNFPATVKEIVRLGRLADKRFPRRFTRDDDTAVERTMAWMGITDIRDKLIGDLSGGLRQRVLLARALAGEPEMLILDEPTTALDPETREHFYNLVFDMNRQRGTTVILVTHDTGTIGRYANRLLYLDKRVIFYGDFDTFCASDEMTGFFGEHAQHIVCHRH